MEFVPFSIIIVKMNVTARLKFELSYFEAAVPHLAIAFYLF